MILCEAFLPHQKPGAFCSVISSPLLASEVKSIMLHQKAKLRHAFDDCKIYNIFCQEFTKNVFSRRIPSFHASTEMITHPSFTVTIDHSSALIVSFYCLNSAAGLDVLSSTLYRKLAYALAAQLTIIFCSLFIIKLFQLSRKLH